MAETTSCKQKGLMQSNLLESHPWNDFYWGKGNTYLDSPLPRARKILSLWVSTPGRVLGISAQLTNKILLNTGVDSILNWLSFPPQDHPDKSVCHFPMISNHAISVVFLRTRLWLDGYPNNKREGYFMAFHRHRAISCELILFYE